MDLGQLKVGHAVLVQLGTALPLPGLMWGGFQPGLKLPALSLR